jgi:hypothetical protein
MTVVETITARVYVYYIAEKGRTARRMDMYDY